MHVQLRSASCVVSLVAVAALAGCKGTNETLPTDAGLSVATPSCMPVADDPCPSVPPRVKPMKYVGQDPEAARDALEAKGYTVRVRHSRFGEIDGVVSLHQRLNNPTRVVLLVTRCSPPEGCPTNPKAKAVAVPNLIGLQQVSAVKTLRALGLEPEVEPGPGQCDPWHSTFYQRPSQGLKLPKGSTVHLLTAERSAGMPVCWASPVVSRDAVRRFYRFADDPRGPAPSVAPVTLSLGDGLVKVIRGPEIHRADAWSLALDGYAARRGTVSALRLVRSSAGNRRVLIGSHPICVGPVITPREVSIQPRHYNSCLNWWSVDLSVNADGQLLGVNVYLYEP